MIHHSRTRSISSYWIQGLEFASGVDSSIRLPDLSMDFMSLKTQTHFSRTTRRQLFWWSYNGPARKGPSSASDCRQRDQDWAIKDNWDLMWPEFSILWKIHRNSAQNIPQQINSNYQLAKLGCSSKNNMPKNHSQKRPGEWQFPSIKTQRCIYGDGKVRCTACYNYAVRVVFLARFHGWGKLNIQIQILSAWLTTNV